MNSLEAISPAQLRRAARLKEKIQSLNAELNRLLGSASAAPKLDRRRRKMSAAAKAKLSAKLKAAWARRKAAKK